MKSVGSERSEGLHAGLHSVTAEVGLLCPGAWLKDKLWATDALP